LYTEKVSITVAADSFQNAGVEKPNYISLDEIHDLKRTFHLCAVRDISLSWQELINGSAGGLFSPGKSDRLHAWITDGKR
jgi:hypothetical protein